jgi:hypothetical protein
VITHSSPPTSHRRKSTGPSKGSQLANRTTAGLRASLVSRTAAQFVRWRPDRDPRSCGYDQLEETVGYDLAEVLATISTWSSTRRRTGAPSLTVRPSRRVQGPVQRRLARNCRSTRAASSCPISADAERSVPAGTESSGSARAGACRPKPEPRVAWFGGPGRLPGPPRSGRSGPGRRRGRPRCRPAPPRRPAAACLRSGRRGQWPHDAAKRVAFQLGPDAHGPAAVAPPGQHVAAAGWRR